MKFIKNIINKINAAKAAKQKNAENRLFNEGFGLAARGIFCSIKLNGHFSLEDDQESAVLYDACKNSNKPFDQGVVAAFDKFCDMNEKFNHFVETVAGIHWKRCDAPNENVFIGLDVLEAIYPANEGGYQPVALVNGSTIEPIPTLDHFEHLSEDQNEASCADDFDPHDMTGVAYNSLPEGYEGAVKVLSDDRVVGVFPNTKEADSCAGICVNPTAGGYGSVYLLPASANEVTHKSANDWFMG